MSKETRPEGGATHVIDAVPKKSMREFIVKELEDDRLPEQYQLGSKSAHRIESYENPGSLSKEDLIAFAENLRRVTGDVVHEDGKILDVLYKWVDQSIESAEIARDSLNSTLRLVKGWEENIEAEKDCKKKIAMLNEYRDLLTGGSNAAEARIAIGLATYISTPDGQSSAIGLARWAANGFPQITMGHKYAAALLVTNVTEEAVDSARPPWDGFVIEVPPGLLPIWHPEHDRHYDVKRIIVSQHANHHTNGEKAWMYVAMTETTMNMWRFGVSSRELLPPIVADDRMENYPALMPMSGSDKRVSSLIGRLVINVCLAMSDPSNVTEVGPNHRAYRQSASQRTTPEPLLRTFQVGKPIKLDFRDRVKEYVLHGDRAKSSINVQSLVCGHFKMQPHGPKNTLRKLIWRQPFWRGPEDAPILVRPHEIEKEEA
jgi:hypothetical protein